MPYGPHIPKMFDASMTQDRYVAHFISAIRIDCLQDKDDFKRHLSEMMNELRNEPRMDKEVPVQVAGDPEKKIAAKRKMEGVPLSQTEYDALIRISGKYGIKFQH
jgi:LDH2 family malate/lactate/ureidoglycolate dehydrogenase